jgi:hypothetical protein
MNLKSAFILITFLLSSSALGYGQAAPYLVMEKNHRTAAVPIPPETPFEEVLNLPATGTKGYGSFFPPGQAMAPPLSPTPGFSASFTSAFPLKPSTTQILETKSWKPPWTF